MKILWSLLLIILIVGTSLYHGYGLYKSKDTKTMYIFMGIVTLSIALGVLSIYSEQQLSISRMFNSLIPW